MRATPRNTSMTSTDKRYQLSFDSSVLSREQVIMGKEYDHDTYDELRRDISLLAVKIAAPGVIVGLSEDYSNLGQKKRYKYSAEVTGVSLSRHHSNVKMEVTLKPDPSHMEQLEELLTLQRKSQHIELCQNSSVEHTANSAGFEGWCFVPTSLPNLCPSDVSTEVTFCDRTFSMPCFITPMTGGTALGKELNFLLAEVCSELNIPMGIGSQRAALEGTHLADMFAVKKHRSDVFVIGNLGISQLNHPHFLNDFLKACEMVEADVMSIHVNLLQELIQEEGQRQFRHIWQHLEECILRSPVPVMIKEVGCGIDVATAKRLENIGVAVIDVGGAGGTSWSAIEGARHHKAGGKQLGELFRSWGIPTANNLHTLKQAGLQVTLTATGGIRDGLQGAKAFALGADMVGLGLPVIRAALSDLEQMKQGNDASQLKEFLLNFHEAFRITQALTSSPTPSHLRAAEKLQHAPYPYASSSHDAQS